MIEIKKARTIKGILDDKYLKMPYKEFSKLIKKSKILYDTEKVFLKLYHQLDFTWDIEVEFFLLAYSYELTKEEFYGVLYTINPQSNQVITGNDLKKLFYDGEKIFEPCEIKDIADLFRR